MGFGRGKVILLGEHAVVHGCPAIAVGIERGVTAEAVTAERDLLRLSPWDLALGPDSNGDEPLERAFAAALAMYPSRPALEVSAQVDLPAGAGLGVRARASAGLGRRSGVPPFTDACLRRRAPTVPSRGIPVPSGENKGRSGGCAEGRDGSCSCREN